MNTRKNNASKKVRWDGHTYTSVLVFCSKVSILFNENMYPHKARRLIKNNLNFHGHKITLISKRIKPEKIIQSKNDPLVWNNTFFDDYKDMADIMDVKKSVIKACLRNDEPFQG